MGAINKQSLFNEASETAKNLEQEVFLNSSEFKTKKTKANAGALMGLLKKQEFRCALSGVPLTPQTAVIDHIIPVSSGGGNELSNLQWLHKDVNRAKSVLTQDEFMRICRQVVAYQS